MANTRTRLTVAQRKELIEAYAVGGKAAADPIALRMGVSSSHAANIANEAGVRRPNHNKTKDRDDPRWRWAIERGPVLV